MKLTSIFNEPIRKLEKEFFSRRNDTYSWPNDRRPLVIQRPELLDRREYSEIVESKIEDEEIAKCTENELQLKINCIEFRPEEITVTVEDNQLLIEGFQERKTENGKTKRFFRRQIQLPNDSLTKEMNCTAKLNGVLSISIPRFNKNEKIIPIRLETNNSTTNLNQQRFNQTIRSNSQTQTVNPKLNETIINRTDSQISNQSQPNQQSNPQSNPLSNQQSNPLSNQQSNPLSNQQSNPLSNTESNPLSNTESNPQSSQQLNQFQNPIQPQQNQLNQQNQIDQQQTKLDQQQTKLDHQQNKLDQQQIFQKNTELTQTHSQQSVPQLQTQLSMNLTSPGLINRQKSTIVTN